MPLRVPTFEPRVQGAPNPTASGRSLEGEALTQAGRGVSAIGEKLLYLEGVEEEKRKTARNAFEKNMALVNMEKGLVEFNDKMSTRTDWGNIPGEHAEYSEKLMGDILGGIQDPEVQASVIPQLQLKAVHNGVQVKHFARQLENNYMMADYQRNVDWFANLIGTTTDDYKRGDYEKEFRGMTEDFVKAGIIKADKAENIVSTVLGRADHIRLNQWMDRDPQFVADRINDPEFLPNLDPMIRSSAKRTAENELLHLENLKAAKINRLQEQNAEVVSDYWDQFRHGKLSYGNFARNLWALREPDANNVRPISRQVFDMYMNNADVYLKSLKSEGESKPNPAQYVQLTKELLDENAPLTLNTIEKRIKEGSIDPKFAIHFADAVKMRDLAEGKKEALTEKQERQKVAGQILMDEMKFVTNSFQGKEIAAEDMWRITQEIQTMVMDMTKSEEPMDRHEIHKKVAVLIEPMSRSWLQKMWKTITTSEPSRDEGVYKEFGGKFWGSETPSYTIGGSYNGKKIKDVWREKGVPKKLRLEDGTVVDIK